MTYRALTDAESRALLLADEHGDGRVFRLRKGLRDRLVAAGFAQLVDHGGPYPVAFITDTGRAAVRQHGSSGGRA